MKKTKMEKGITLIALIITIVVLLILAVVAINSITNDGLLGKAENAANKYNQSVSNEQDMLGRYEEFLNNYASGGSSSSGGSGGSTTPTTGAWTQSGTSVTNGSVTLTVGQTVSGYDGYSGSYTGGWAVLGAENGKLLLVSKVNVQSSVKLKGKEGDTSNGYQAGYNNGIAYLNSLCTSYLNSTLAEEARSIKVEDINRVTGYNPETAGYGAGYPYQYGNTVTYTLDSDGKVVYTSKDVTGSNASGTSSYTKFEHVDGTVLTTSNSIDVTSNSYYYYPNTLTTSSSGTTKGIETTSDAYKVLFEGTDTNYYWLASQYQYARAGFAHFGLRYVYGGCVRNAILWYSNYGADGGSSGVRAVVSLKSGVNISSSGVIS